jgi:hypothetical protein
MTEFLYQKLEEIDEQEGLYTEGDALLFQFYCGNWSASVQRMRDENIRWEELLDYVDEHEEWNDQHGHFDRHFWGELGASLARPQ